MPAMTWPVRGWFRPSNHAALCQASVFPPLHPTAREGPLRTRCSALLCLPSLISFSPLPPVRRSAPWLWGLLALALPDVHPLRTGGSLQGPWPQGQVSSLLAIESLSFPVELAGLCSCCTGTYWVLPPVLLQGGRVRLCPGHPLPILGSSRKFTAFKLTSCVASVNSAWGLPRVCDLTAPLADEGFRRSSH